VRPARRASRLMMPLLVLVLAGRVAITSTVMAMTMVLGC
jgi:hypothetical protein